MFFKILNHDMAAFEESVYSKSFLFGEMSNSIKYRFHIDDV